MDVVQRPKLRVQLGEAPDPRRLALNQSLRITLSGQKGCKGLSQQAFCVGVGEHAWVGCSDVLDRISFPRKGTLFVCSNCK